MPDGRRPPLLEGRSVMEHLTPHPVNYSTYTNHGCRCDGCRRANAEQTAVARRRRAAGEAVDYKPGRAVQARHRAVNHLIERHPDEFNRLLSVERQALGVD